MRVYSHSHWLVIFVPPIAAECWRGRGGKLSTILGKNTIFNEHPVHKYNTIHTCAYNLIKKSDTTCFVCFEYAPPSWWRKCRTSAPDSCRGKPTSSLTSIIDFECYLFSVLCCWHGNSKERCPYVCWEGEHLIPCWQTLVGAMKPTLLISLSVR